MTEKTKLSRRNKNSKLIFHNINKVFRSTKNVDVQEHNPPPALDPKDEYSFCFTHINNDDERSIIGQYKKIINDAVANNTYLLICSYYFNNYEAIELLEKASSKLKGKIYVLVGNQKDTNISFNQHLECMDKGFLSLISNGILVRCANNAHLKFISNGNECLIHTTNLSTQGLFYNPEFGVRLTSKPMIDALNRLFSYLWFKQTNSMLLNDGWDTIPENDRAEIYVNRPFRHTSKSKNKLIVSSKDVIREINSGAQIVSNDCLFDVIVDLMDSAQNVIDIAMYKIVFSKGKLEKIKQKLLEKAKDSVKIRILIPSVKVKISKFMRKSLDQLKHKNIEVKYYRELHGKCIIVDNKETLIMTGNMDKYLLDDTSKDIGYVMKNAHFVQNSIKFFNHIWDDAADECEIDVPIDLHINLIIRSYEQISSRIPISVHKLENKIHSSKSIRFYRDNLECLLSIELGSGRPWKLYIKLHNKEPVEDQGDTLALSGMINHHQDLKRSKAESFSVRNLSLKLLWKLR
ncbi:MAG: hypothetical protein GF364_13310 [Candidatus Lokiarchaeota archaeon]|nr:hypothetical protein [Candidatus Lokiarchaeota archaeon]